MKHRIAVILLVLIALTNRVVVHQGTLSPWELGGFGMFASIDSPGSRVLQVRGATEAGTTMFVEIPSSLTGLESRVRFWPTDDRLAELGERLEQEAFTVEDGVLTPDDDGQFIDVIRIDVFRLIEDDGVVGLESIAVLVNE